MSPPPTDARAPEHAGRCARLSRRRRLARDRAPGGQRRRARHDGRRRQPAAGRRRRLASCGRRRPDARAPERPLRRDAPRLRARGLPSGDHRRRRREPDDDRLRAAHGRKPRPAGYPGCALACHTTGEPGAPDGGFPHVVSELGAGGESRSRAGTRCPATCTGWAASAASPATGRARFPKRRHAGASCAPMSAPSVTTRRRATGMSWLCASRRCHAPTRTLARGPNARAPAATRPRVSSQPFPRPNGRPSTGARRTVPVRSGSHAAPATPFTIPAGPTARPACCDRSRCPRCSRARRRTSASRATRPMPTTHARPPPRRPSGAVAEVWIRRRVSR